MKNTDFDNQWQRRARRLAASECPLSDDQMAALIARAKLATPAVGCTPHPYRGWLHAKAAAPVAAAACLALIAIPLTTSHQSDSDSIVTHRGVQVYFACNNHCSADHVLNALDAKILHS